MPELKQQLVIKNYTAKNIDLLDAAVSHASFLVLRMSDAFISVVCHVVVYIVLCFLCFVFMYD